MAVVALCAAGSVPAATSADTPSHTQASAARVLDDFQNPAAWKASASDDVKASLRVDGARGLCLDYDFNGVSGYAVLRRSLPLDFPENFVFDLRLRGQGPTNDFQFKLTDASGDNVWWINRPSFAFTPEARTLRVKKRHISFAWGPAADHALRHTEALEFVVVAREGGRGSACFERLAFTPLPPAAAQGSAVLLRDVRLDAGNAPQRIALPAPWPGAREFNGLVLRWPSQGRAIDYDVELADETGQWQTVRRVRGGEGRVDALFLPESDARNVALRVLRSRGESVRLESLEARSAEQWPDLNAVWRERAANEPRSRHPRAFHGEQNYWTLVGVDGGGAHAALISEDGEIEPARGGPSLQPVVLDDDGRLVGWSDVTITQGLREGYLPMPAVHWQHAAFALDIEATAAGTRTSSQLLTRYTLRNAGEQPRTLTLVLALQPWQVNPPQQFLNIAGGASTVKSLQWRDGVLEVNGRALLRPLRTPDVVTGQPYDSGSVLHTIAARTPPAPLAQLDDPNAMASAALVFKLQLPARGSQSVVLAWPLSGTPSMPTHADEAWANAQFEQVAAHWRERLNRVSMQLPPSAQRIHDSLRSALAHILMSRDGAALQPGTRSYARSWIRDGAMMVAGLLRLGEQQAAREFVQWYADKLFANGKVPCCVDARGADPVVENDSAGEFIFAVAELWRHTHDVALLQRLYPKVVQATLYMDKLRQSERIPANTEGARAAWWGLMPASISHEGYSEKPMHSYWDDFWTLRGYKDAVELAQAARRAGFNGHATIDMAQAFARMREEFQQELVASIRHAAAQHHVAFIPGAAELGDFDPTSTTVALSVAQAQDRLPAGMLHATFERYWQESVARREGRRAWQDYTPYELRTVGAFVRLNQPERAHAMLDFFFADQRPKGWNQWAEVVMREPRQVHFLGDMPHAWISSDYIRSALELLAYERESDGAIVIGAGVPRAWLDEGVAVRGLSTASGRLGYRLRRQGRDVVLEIDAGVAPPGGVVLAWPGADRLPRATRDGRALAWTGRELRIRALPARIHLTP